MTGRTAFELWAPPEAGWAQWARPVPFAAAQSAPGPAMLAGFAVPGIAYLNTVQADTAIVADLPGADGVAEGIALARLGIRPVPLYNGTRAQTGAMALVEPGAIESALLWGAGELAKINLPPNAPPAFLLDWGRLHRHKMNPSVFDNSWDLYEQDMPSANYLLAHGIRRVLVRGQGIARDLAHILYKYQKKGLAILFTGGYGPPAPRRLRKPRKRF